METLLKWPGGKGREFPQVRHHIPAFKTYVEPFFGGGAFFFHLMPPHSLLNDVNANLIGLYASVRSGDPAFQAAIESYVASWERLQQTIDDLRPSLRTLYTQARTAADPPAQLTDAVTDCLASYAPSFNADFASFQGDAGRLWKTIEASVRAKYLRLPKLERDNDIRFDDALMADHIATAFRAGLYTYFRDVFVPRSEAEEIANFYFLREFCYGSMFRFNKAGKFNIPYGGIGYNGKDFRTKAARLFSPRTRALFSGVELSNLDFRAFFHRNWERLDGDTFCFLDPPYDTQFSAYDNCAFGPKDQECLAGLFMQLRCKAMLIIKDTEFIRRLYEDARQENPRVQIDSFDKTYSYNVRGRNDRNTQHLLIRNYV